MRMLAGTAEVIRHLAEWDEGEEVWDVFIPLPSAVSVLVGDIRLQQEVAMELDELLEAAGIDFRGIRHEADRLTVFGITLA